VHLADREREFTEREQRLLSDRQELERRNTALAAAHAEREANLALAHLKRRNSSRRKWPRFNNGFKALDDDDHDRISRQFGWQLESDRKEAERVNAALLAAHAEAQDCTQKRPRSGRLQTTRTTFRDSSRGTLRKQCEFDELVASAPR